jgi:hypothetical protein
MQIFELLEVPLSKFEGTLNVYELNGTEMG